MKEGSSPKKKNEAEIKDEVPPSKKRKGNGGDMLKMWILQEVNEEVERKSDNADEKCSEKNNEKNLKKEISDYVASRFDNSIDDF